MTKVSIIIPVYNGEKYINRCIDSVLNQSYSSFEIIIVDNDSSDSSYEVCKQYSNKYSFIHLEKETERGPGNARNRGIICATGEYITFLDCDDYWESNYLDRMVYVLDSFESLDLVICGRFYHASEDGLSNLIVTGKEQYVNETINRSSFLSNPYTYFKHAGTRGPVCKMFRKTIIQDNRIMFPQNLSAMEDLCFCMEYVSFSRNVEMIEEVLYHQIIHNDSLSKGSAFLHDVTAWYDAIRAIDNVIAKTNYVDWNQFYMNLKNGFPYQYINWHIRSHNNIFSITTDIVHYLNSDDVKKFIVNETYDKKLRKMNSWFYSFLYVIKRKMVLFGYRVSSCCH